jgi:predicted GTPase/uncharacterized protein (DUF697 family)
MGIRQTISGLIILLAAALCGLALILLPNWLIDQYQSASALGRFWGTLYLLVVGFGLLLLVGSSFWLVWKLWGRSVAKHLRRQRRNKNPSELSLEQKSRETEENLDAVRDMRAAMRNEAMAAELEPVVDALTSKRQRQTLEIVAFGTVSGGKSSVLNAIAGRNLFATDVRGGTTVQRSEVPWDRLDRVILVDTPGLGEIDGAEHVAVAAQSAKNADLILLVVDGPLRESESQLLTSLGAMEKRIVVCLNKSDWYTPEDREKLLQQIRRQTERQVESEDVIAIQSESTTRRRLRVRSDQETIEEQVPVPSDIGTLADRMTTILRREGKDLLAANLLLQSRGLLEQARNRAQQSIDREAQRIVDRHMWAGGGVAAVIPFPVVDLVAGIGVSTKMILDLAEVYQQKVDLETARRWLGEMGKNLVGILGVNLAAPAVVSVVGSLLKTVPFAGTIAGGMLQGLVQALVIKWIGAVFCEYFRNEMRAPEGGLAGLARRQWERVTTVDELRRLVQLARAKWAGGDPQ